MSQQARRSNKPVVEEFLYTSITAIGLVNGMFHVLYNKYLSYLPSYLVVLETYDETNQE